MSPGSKTHDLSYCEQQRLENIRRNELFLASLGIGAIKQEINRNDEAEEVHVESANEENLKKRKREIKKSVMRKKELKGREPSRRSSRFMKTDKTEEVHLEGEEEEKDEDTDGTYDYSVIPQESYQLDDDEFQAFVVLKAWRLRTFRALEIEPFKIFQNRTLCEMVRRRRNNKTWATENFDPLQSVLPRESHKESDTAKLKEYSLADQLMMCWGIGPSKVKQDSEGPGFAWGALEILNDENDFFDKEDGSRATKLTISNMLQASRSKTTN